MADTFEVLNEVNRQYQRFNAQGTQLTIRLLPPPDDSNIDPITHFESSMNALFNYTLRNVDDSDMVGVVIQNENTQTDKPIGFSFRRKDQLSTEVIWRLFEKVTQSNARFNAMDKLVVTVHSVKLPAGSGLTKTKGRQIDNSAHLKRSSMSSFHDCAFNIWVPTCPVFDSLPPQQVLKRFVQKLFALVSLYDKWSANIRL
jgi:hypothetical protein